MGSYRTGALEHVQGPRLGPCGSWFTDLWFSWSNLAAVDPRTPGFSSSQRERLHIAFFLKQPFLCAGVWDQKQWAEDSQGFGAPVWASVAPEHDRTSVEGTPPLAPTGLAPGTYRATEAQLQPVCCAPGLGSRGRNGAPRLGTCVCPGASQKHKCCPPGHELATR